MSITKYLTHDLFHELLFRVLSYIVARNVILFNSLVLRWNSKLQRTIRELELPCAIRDILIVKQKLGKRSKVINLIAELRARGSHVAIYNPDISLCRRAIPALKIPIVAPVMELQISARAHCYSVALSFRIPRRGAIIVDQYMTSGHIPIKGTIETSTLERYIQEKDRTRKRLLSL